MLAVRTHPLLALVAALALSTAASASTLSYVSAYGTAAVQVPLSRFPVTLSLPKFDTTLGTLTAVTLSLTSSGSTAYANLINATSVPQAYSSATAQLNLVATGPGGTSVGVSPSAGPFAGTLPVVSNFGYTTVGSGTQGASTDSQSIAPANFSSYEGFGDNNVTVNLTGSGTFGGNAQVPGAIYFGGTGSAFGEVGVTYTFTAIPEPSTYAAILGMAAFGWAAIRRRRAKPDLCS